MNQVYVGKRLSEVRGMSDAPLELNMAIGGLSGEAVITSIVEDENGRVKLVSWSVPKKEGGNGFSR